jgi:hypothetical protein
MKARVLIDVLFVASALASIGFMVSRVVVRPGTDTVLSTVLVIAGWTVMGIDRFWLRRRRKPSATP